MQEDKVFDSLKQLLNSGTLQQLVDKIGEELGAPSIVIDASHRILAKTSDSLVNLKSWEQFRGLDYMPVNFFTRELTSESGGITSKYFLVPSMGEKQDVRLIRRALALGGNIIGYICFLIGDQDNIEDISIIEWATRLALILLVNDHPIAGAQLPYQAFLAALIENPELNPTKEIAEAQCRRLNIRLSRHMYILSAHIGELPDSIMVTIQDILDALNRVIPNSYPFLYKESIVVLFGKERSSDNLELFLSPLNQSVKDYNLTVGVSNNFGSLTQFHAAYVQAQKAIGIGRRIDKEKHLFLYEDYTYYYMMEICSNNYDLKSFCHPSILELLYRDTMDGTSHLRTLYQYLCNRNSLIKTAEDLGVHRNTIKYRISQIMEITGADLSDGLVIFTLLKSLQILIYLGLL